MTSWWDQARAVTALLRAALKSGWRGLDSHHTRLHVRFTLRVVAQVAGALGPALYRQRSDNLFSWLVEYYFFQPPQAVLRYGSRDALELLMPALLGSLGDMPVPGDQYLLRILDTMCFSRYFVAVACPRCQRQAAGEDPDAPGNSTRGDGQDQRETLQRHAQRMQDQASLFARALFVRPESTGAAWLRQLTIAGLLSRHFGESARAHALAGPLLSLGCDLLRRLFLFHSTSCERAVGTIASLAPGQPAQAAARAFALSFRHLMEEIHLSLGFLFAAFRLFDGQRAEMALLLSLLRFLRQSFQAVESGWARAAGALQRHEANLQAHMDAVRAMVRAAPERCGLRLIGERRE
jgi:hypothetical protein